MELDGTAAPGLLGRAGAGLAYALTGRPPAWFAPGRPPRPMARPRPAGRQFDYPPGFNQRIRPREHAALGFAALRRMARDWDLARLLIEARKDQLATLAWTVRGRAGAGVRSDDPRLARLAALLERPDGEHGWAAWLRILVEDLLVLDAPTLYLRRDRAGRLVALEPVDGATIKRVIDAGGRTPAPPEPAYQQILKGVPAVDYTTEELLYLPRNPRSNRVYGCSPVERIRLTVEAALGRQQSQLACFTAGDMPAGIVGVPPHWSAAQTRDLQDWWDALLAGEPGERRRLRFVPGGLELIATRDPPLKDGLDEWLARVACLAFAVDPQPFVREAAPAARRQAALAQGQAPLRAWVKGLVDRVIGRHLGWDDIEFAWVPAAVGEPARRERVEAIYVAAGIKTRNEAREALGLAPVADGDGPTLDPAAIPLAQILARGPVAKGADLGWDAAKHPRWPRGMTGRPHGGEFRPGDAAPSAEVAGLILPVADTVTQAMPRPVPITPVRPPPPMEVPPPPPSNDNAAAESAAAAEDRAAAAARVSLLGLLIAEAVVGTKLGELAGQFYAGPEAARAKQVADLVRGQLVPGSPQADAVLRSLPFSPFAYGLGPDSLINDLNALLSLKAGRPIDFHTDDPADLAAVIAMPWPSAEQVLANAEYLKELATAAPPAADQLDAAADAQALEQVKEEICLIACACLADRTNEATGKDWCTYQACVAAWLRDAHYDPESGDHPQGGPKYPRSPDADGPRPEQSYRPIGEDLYKAVTSRKAPGMPSTAPVVAGCPRPDISWWLLGRLWKIFELKFFDKRQSDMQAAGEYRKIAKAHGLDPVKDVVDIDVPKDCGCQDKGASTGG